MGYYRSFIKGFSKSAAPSHALLVGTDSIGQGKRAFDWTPEFQVGFDTLKTVLAYAYFCKPFHLYNNASFGGLGAVLAQVQDSREKVIAYASLRLHPSERNNRNYSSFKLEFLPLKRAVPEKFKATNSWLLQLTTFLSIQTHLRATEQRWAAQLAIFDFESKYRQGIANRNADVLSGLSQETVPTQQAETMPTQEAQVLALESHTAPDVGNQWKDLQEREPALVQVKEWVTEGQPPRPEERKASPPVARCLLKM